MGWDSLSSDLTELILSHLPIPTLIRATTVCKRWRSIISSAYFSTHFDASKKPWFFLYGHHNLFSKSNQIQAFAFDTDSFNWVRLPSILFCAPSSDIFFSGSGGYLFATASGFSYSPILRGLWRQTSPLHLSRCDPLVGVFNSDKGSPGLIVAGGVRCIGGLVNIEDRLAVELYDPPSNSWELCPPLPSEFKSGNSSQWLTSGMFRNKFYVFEIHTGCVSSFDLVHRSWSVVQTLRPHGVRFSFLIPCHAHLVLAGLCLVPHGISLNLWRVDEKTMEFTEVSVMPDYLLYGLFDSDGEDKFASLKCVGLGNLIFVFNEEYHRNYPACVCEIDSVSGEYRWRRVPHLPSPVKQFHKVICFCSSVPLGGVVSRGKDGSE